MLDTIFDPSFIEKALLLILTAALTGVLVPYINAKLSDRKFKEQRLFDAEIARQNKIIDAQNELLVELERLVHTFQLRAFAVAWYKVADKNPNRYEKSRNEYEDNAWEFFVKMQTLIGKARRLTSLEVHKKLEQFYDEMTGLDMNLVKLIKHDKIDEEWQELINKLKSHYGNELKEMMDSLAQDYGLSKTMRLEKR